ncbi:ABC transporter substrate-binding protein [Atopobiaceae bacterium 24-176]
MALYLCVLFACVVLCGCAQVRGHYIKNNLERNLATVESGTLTVASDFASPPMEFVDSAGQRRGFECDLVCEVADRLSLDVEFVACDDLAAVDAAVGNRTADLGASAIMLGDFSGDTFSNLTPGSAYMTAGRDVVVPRNRPIKGVEQLNDPSCTIVVQGGSANEEWAREAMPRASILAIDNAVEGLTGVANGTYTAAVYDDVSATYLINSMFGGLMVGHHQDDVSRYCFAFSPEASDIKEAVDEVLADLEADGFIDSLEVKWFGSTLA